MRSILDLSRLAGDEKTGRRAFCGMLILLGMLGAAAPARAAFDNFLLEVDANELQVGGVANFTLTARDGLNPIPNFVPADDITITAAGASGTLTFTGLVNIVGNTGQILAGTPFDGNGQRTFTASYTVNNEAVTFTALDAGGVVNVPPNPVVTWRALDNFLLTVNTTNPEAGGPATFTITARDNLNPIPNFVPADDITITASGASGTITFTDLVNIVGNTGQILAGTAFDAAGQRTFTATYSTSGEPVTFSALDAGLVGSTPPDPVVTWVPGAVANYLLQVDTTSPVAGTSAVFTITARNQFNVPIPNYVPTSDITITATGASGTVTFTGLTNIVGNTGQIAAGTPFDGDGQRTFTATYTVVGQAVTFSALDGGGIGSTPPDPVVTWTAGTLNNFLLAVDTASPDAGDTVTFTITARNLANVAIPNFVPASDITITASGASGTLTFTGLTGIVGNTGKIAAGTAFNALGQRTFKAKYTVAGEPVTFSALDGGGVGSEPPDPVVTWAAGTLTSFLLQVNTTTPAAGSQATFTITARNGFGVPIANFVPASDITITATGASGTLTFTGLTGVVGNTGKIAAGTPFDPNGQRTFTAAYTTAGEAVTFHALDGGGVGNVPPDPVVNWTSAAAHHLAFAVQPVNTAAGGLLTPTVAVRDIHGNLVTGDNGRPIGLTLLNAGGATLDGTTGLVTVNGLAAWTAAENLHITLVGAGYQLRATQTGAPLPGGDTVNSNTFNVTAAAATRLEITTTGPYQAGIPFGATVKVTDSYGNDANVSQNTDVGLVVENGTGGLSGTTTGTILINTGSLSFNNVIYSKRETGVRLGVVRLTGDPLVSGTSAPFNVDAGPAVALEFVQQPTNIVANDNFVLPIVVRVRDALGNTVNTAAPIHLALDTNPTNNPAVDPGVLVGDFDENAVDGVATFANPLTVQHARVGYSLRATSPAVADALSTAFTVTARPWVALQFVQGPSNAGIGIKIRPKVTVELVDGFGNRDLTATNAVSIEFDPVNPLNPPNAALAGNVVNAASGLATFDDLAVNQIGSGFTILARSGAVTSAVSSPFNITAGKNLRALPLEIQQDNPNQKTLVTISYAVEGPDNSPPFTIQLGRDTDPNDGIDMINVLIQTIPITNAEPALLTIGVHSLAPIDVRAALNGVVKNAERLVVVVDVNDDMAGETSDVDNVAFTPLTVDLVADSTDASDVSNVSVRYTVDSPANVPASKVELWLERNGALVAPRLAQYNGNVVPGTHTINAVNLSAALNNVRVQNGDRIVTVLDPANTVSEPMPETNNRSTSAGFLVDLRLDAVQVDATRQNQVTVTYTVVGPARVPDFTLQLGLNGPNSLLGSAAGKMTPGTYTVQFDIAQRLIDNLVAAGEAFTVVARLVPAAAMNEPAGNNERSAGGTYSIDLSIESVRFDGTDLDVPFDITITYLVATNRPPTDFSLGIYASLEDVFDASAVLLGRVVVPAASVAVGLNTLDVAGLVVARNDVFRDTDFSLIVRIDDLEQVTEGNENNNLATRLNVFADAQNIDADGDGLTRGQEQRIGYSIQVSSPAGRYPDEPAAPLRAVTSDDNPDTDADGIADPIEADIDGTNPFGATNPQDPDTDGDGIPDGVEDANQNGLVDPGETDPRNWDTDGDELSDLEERAGFLVTRYAAESTSGRFAGTTQARVVTDPLVADTDGDGISDWDEVNTFARQAAADGSVPSIGLGAIAARAGREVSKPVWGVRTDPTATDSDADGDPDDTDPAPQLHPARWGYDQNGDGQFDDADLELIRADFVSGGASLERFPADVAAFQSMLLNFDQDGDGFLEAPDANGDGFPDFTRYNEATLEQSFGIDFSNDGTLNDGFDVGGLGRAEAGPYDDRCGSSNQGMALFGTYRVISSANGRVIGDGQLDTLDEETEQLIPTDNCPTKYNPEQLDYDGDGLGDDCDADLDNDGVQNDIDPRAQPPTGECGGPTTPLTAMCGMGVVEGMIGCLVGMAAVGLAGRSRYGRRG